MSPNALLKEKAFLIRRDVIKSLTVAGSGHLGGSLGLADIFAAFYFSILRHDPTRPDWRERDRLILSIGHVAPVLYASLAHSGYFPVKELLTLRKLGSRLQGHPGRDHGLPGIELAAGSLGQGLSVGVGMALAHQIDRKKGRINVVLGDGELQEGSVWEAAMSAAHHNLNNLIAIVDRNSLQIDGTTESVMALEPLVQKWEAFGWNVKQCNGNDIESFVSTYYKDASNSTKPTVIIAQTTMGKGVKSIEGDYRWHGRAPSLEEEIDFLRELEETFKA